MTHPTSILNRVVLDGKWQDTYHPVNLATTRLPNDRIVLVLWDDGTWTHTSLGDLR